MTEAFTMDAATPEDRARWREMLAGGWRFVRVATFKRDGVRVERVTLVREARDE